MKQLNLYSIQLKIANEPIKLTNQSNIKLN